MKTSQTFTLFLLVDLCIANFVRIGCRIDETCSSGYAWTYTDKDGGITTSCATSEDDCRTYQDFNFDTYVEKCQCQTGVCLYPTIFQQCLSDSSCFTNIEYQARCGECRSIQCTSGSCISYYSTQQCTFSDCFFEKATVKIQNCQEGKAIFGESCGCCINYIYKESSYQDLRVCSNIFEYDSQQLRQMASQQGSYFNDVSDLNKDQDQRQAQNQDEKQDEKQFEKLLTPIIILSIFLLLNI